MRKCDKCGEERDDVLMRLILGETLVSQGFFVEELNHKGEMVQRSYDPALCHDCCAQIPGREWMKKSALCRRVA